MKKVMIGIIFTSFILAFNEPSFAIKGVMIFPKEGQGQEQKSKDTAYCNNWAREETGIDPSYVKAKLDMMAEMESESKSGTSQMARAGGMILRGAARGAAMGAIDDAIDSEAGSRAAQGALGGGMQYRQSKKTMAAQQKQNRQAQKTQNLMRDYDAYLRGFSVCMDAKGYSVR